MLFLLAANTGKSGVFMASIAPEIPNLQIVVWRKNDIKKSGITRFRAYFEIPKFLKVLSRFILV